MITIIEDYNRQEHAALLSAMFLLRAASFCAWRLPVNAAGEERDKFDQFDHMSPVYVISHNRDHVDGALRLLPSTGPTLFEESVEPGTFPLAHGIQRRASKLRAYGNAIVPQVGAAFIEAFMPPSPPLRF